MTDRPLRPYNDGMSAESAARCIYLDHAATTPLLPEAAEAMREAHARYPANPASQHGPGREARRALEAARRQIGELLGAQVGGPHADRVVFTSGGTEANNLALAGLQAEGRRLIVSAVEHPSVAAFAQQTMQRGGDVEVLPVDRRGVVQLDALASLLADRRPALVSIQLASNETGVLQPIRQIADLCADRQATLHTDAVQAVGKVDVNFRQLGVAALSCTAHKFHGPLGIGALLVHADVTLEPLLAGGHQQGGLRPGTETVALAVGMCTALEAYARQARARQRQLAELRDRLEQQLLVELPKARLVPASEGRLPHISNIALPGFDRQALVMALDLAGVACSTGSACASGSSEPSPTLLAMGLADDVISGSIRLSLGADTTADEIDLAARRILSVAKQLRTPESA